MEPGDVLHLAPSPHPASTPPAGAVSPELVSVIEMVRGVGTSDAGLSVHERRALVDFDTDAGPGVSVEEVDAGGVPCEWIVGPGASVERAVLHLHGGAYTSCGLGSHRAFAGALSAASACAVLNVDYRLAPEAPFPAALDDALAAYRWLTAPGRLHASSVVVSGDSAGGGLAAELLVGLRDEGGVAPAGAVLLSPWTDLALTGDSHATERDRDPICSTDMLAQSVAAYLPHGVAPDDPRVSPLYADLSQLPPLLVHVGEVEVLRDDAVRFAGRARSAGTPVELLVAPGMVHVWHLFAGWVPESTRDLHSVGRWVRDHQRPTPPRDRPGPPPRG